MDIRQIDLNLLVVFDALLEARSVTLAGRRLGLSQPAMSYALSRLRVTFNDPLFIRVNNEMQPTPRALALAGPTRRILDQVRMELLQSVDFDPSRTVKTVTLCMSDIGEMVFLPPIIRVVMQSAPNATLRSVYMPPEKLEQAMEAGEVDLAVGYFPDLHKAGFFQQRLFTSGFACLARPDNPYVDNRLTLSRYLKAPHVSVRAEGRSQEIVEKYVAKRKLKRWVPLTVPHFLSLVEILPQTELIATVPRVMAESLSAAATLKIHPLPFTPPGIPVNQFWHRRYHKDPSNQWVRGLVRALFQKG